VCGSYFGGSKALFDPIRTPVVPERPRYKTGQYQYGKLNDQCSARDIDIEKRDVSFQKAFASFVTKFRRFGFGAMGSFAV
jgi:hypothetical protein